MHTTPKVNRDLFEPNYIQLVRIFQDQISTGLLRPGDRLPSESQLCKNHHISRMTVRRAINILVEQGFVVTERGRGTFVKPIQFWSASFNLNQLRNLLSDENKIKIKILEASITNANDILAQKMKVNRGQRLLHIRRLILSVDKPIIYHREYLLYDPSRPIVESELDVTELKCLFEGTSNSYIKYGSLSLEATVLNDNEARILQIPEATASLTIEHTFFDFEDRPISWGHFICPGLTLTFTTLSA